MNPNPQAAKEALRRSQIALRKGEKDIARHWAEKAASLAPELEDPWLLLAAVSRPQVSIRYLERALALNPNSERAQKGMVWAQRRLKLATDTTKPQKAILKQEESTKPTQAVPGGGILRIPVQQIEETQPAQKVTTTSKSRTRFWRQSLPALLLTVIIVSTVWALFPRVSSFAANLQATPTEILSQEHWGEANISKPTYTPSPTATFTPTLTPTITPSPTITPTFTPAPTQTPYPTAEAQEEAPPAPQPQGPNLSGAKYVLVDISEQHLYAYQGNTLIYSFVASTGMNNATATGNFSVLNKIPNAYGATWDIWMPNWLGIYWAGTLQNGIHALPIMSNGGTLWAGYLGTPISYGCVVLGTYEAQQLYNWVDVGTPVDIQW